MDTELHRFLTEHHPRAASTHLIARVTTEVHRLDRQRARRRSVAFGVGLVGAVGVTTTVGVYLYQVLQTTGFFYYVTLLSLPNSVLVAHSKELMLSILSSLPLVEVSVFLLGTMLLLWFGVGLIESVRQLRSIRVHTPFATV